MINRCLIVDTETTGLDPQSGRLIEFGAVLYSVLVRSTLVQYSTLIPCSENPLVHINRISEGALSEIEPGWYVDPLVDRLRDCADVVVAHNADFDRRWFTGTWLAKPWVCTQEDFVFPHQTKPRESLVSLALAHGIGVSSAHRALTDCQLIAAIFDRVEDLQERFTCAMRPKVLLQALVSFDDRQLAKDAGFQWDGAAKRWTRRMATEDATALPFRTKEVV